MIQQDYYQSEILIASRQQNYHVKIIAKQLSQSGFAMHLQYLSHQNYYHMEQTQPCPNCLKQIPLSKTATHFGYCRRNIIKCTTCGEMYDKNFLEDHEEEYHQTSKCTHCAKMMKKSEVEGHNRSCEMRPKFCEYCEQNVPSKDFNTHFKQCESRTSICQLCDRSIVNKEYAIHTATCKGKTKIAAKNDRDTFTNKNDKYNFEDSLSEFWQQSDRKKQKQKQKKVQTIQKEKESPNKREVKKETSTTAAKSKVQTKPNFKKQSVDPKSLSRQHFYDNFINPSPHYQGYEFADYGFEENYGQLDYDEDEDEDRNGYLPQQSFYGKSAFDFQTPSSFQYFNKDTSEISPQEQLIQQTIFQSSKNGVPRHFHENLPEDFMSEDVMNQSFYKDILDIEKQKAILEDLGKNKPKNSSKLPEKKVTNPVSQKPVKRNEGRK